MTRHTKRLAALASSLIVALFATLLAVPTAAMASTSGSGSCKPQTLVFDTTANSNALAEVSGPTVVPTDEFTYMGAIYTIMTINPGAGTFTTFLNNFNFVAGSSLTNQKGKLLCAPVPGH